MVKTIGFYLISFFLISCGAEEASTVITVPFENDKNQIILAVELNGTGPYSFILDTGVDPSVIDIEVAKKAGLPIDFGDENEAAGVGSERRVIYPSELQNITIGGHNFGNVNTVAGDLSAIEARFGRPFHGILGYSFLAGKIIEIDYLEKKVSFLKNGSRSICQNEEGDSCFSIPYETASKGDKIPRLIGIKISGVPINVSMDTGSSGGFDVNPQTLEEMGILFEIDPESSVTVMGARGEAIRSEGAVNNVTLGPFDLGDVPALFETDRFGVENYRQGNVGNIVFKNFIVTLDYVNKRIAFRKKL